MDEPIETDLSHEFGDPSGFGARLAKAREFRGLEQRILAKLTGIPAPTISYFENGHRYPSFENLVKLAGQLNVSIDYLAGRTESMFAHVTAPPEIPLGGAFTKDHALLLVKLLDDGLRRVTDVGWEEDPELPP